MAVQVERTSDAIVLKLPLDTNAKDIQRVLNYFEYLDLVGKSKATAEQIDALAKAAKSGWWERNKARFEGIGTWSRLSHLVGGVVLIGLGAVMILRPDLLA